MSSAGWAGLGTKLHLKLYEKWTSGLNKYEPAASEGQRSLRLWPYVSARTSLQCRFENSKRDYI